MFSKSAEIYDAIYSFKDYSAEADRVRALIERGRRAVGGTLLDVACGTGGHIPFLRQHFSVEGLDLEAGMVEVARSRHPGVAFHRGDMVDFDLGRRYDAVICLFSSIGYVETVPRLRSAVASMARHLEPSGILIVEPWFSPTTFFPGRLSAVFVDQPDLKVARMNVSRVEAGVSAIDFHYLVGTPEGIDSFVESHRLGLFTQEEYEAAFREAGLSVEHLSDGLAGSGERGLFLGRRPA